MPQKKISENNLTPQQRNALVEENMNLVRYFAYKLCKDRQLIDECIQEGCLGLMRAARLFDESRDNAFSSFAAFEIQCSIRDFLFRWRTIRLPDEQRTRINKYLKTVAEMESVNIDISPNLLADTAKEVGITTDVHNQLINSIASLNAVYESESSESKSEFGNCIADNRNEDPLDNIAFEELLNFMRTFFENAKMTDEKTRRVVLGQMNSFIANAFGEEADTLRTLVQKEYPELDVKSKEFDRHYTRISGVWCTHFKNFKKACAEQMLCIG